MAGEGEEDDEPEQHGEAGGEDSEEAGSAVAVIEVAAVWGGPAHEEKGGDCGSDCDYEDDAGDDEVHSASAQAMGQSSQSLRVDQDCPILTAPIYRRATVSAGRTKINRIRNKKNRGCTSSPRIIEITRPGNNAISRIIAINLSNPILPSH